MEEGSGVSSRWGERERRMVKEEEGHERQSLEEVVETRNCTHTELVQLLLLVWTLWPRPGGIGGISLTSSLLS